MRDIKRPASRGLLLALLTLGVWQLGSGLWIQAKAGLAQYLIAAAWQQTLVRHVPVKPWPWADTWPVARLRWQDTVDLYVLSGANGASLPFGPGMEANAADNTLLIAGHRDTHFAFLAHIGHGDRMELIDMQGRKTVFEIETWQVFDSRYERLTVSSKSPALLLVTCYPFDALHTDGPLRLVVKGVAVGGDDRAHKKTALLEAAPLKSTTRGYSI